MISMNGAQVSSAASVGNVPTTWSIVETGDFDGDGKSDILWRDTSGNIALWFMNGATIASGAGLGTIATSWTIQGTNAD
jgi:FG-GAP repeat protein